MSIGPMGSVLFSAAGTSLAQTTGSDVVRAREDAAVQQRSVESQQLDEVAMGVGEPDADDNQTNERDADGRTPWLLGRKKPGLDGEEAADEPAPGAVVDDASAADEHIDLTG
jgi:hypothetical protein